MFLPGKCHIWEACSIDIEGEAFGACLQACLQHELQHHIWHTKLPHLRNKSLLQEPSHTHHTEFSCQFFSLNCHTKKYSEPFSRQHFAEAKQGESWCRKIRTSCGDENKKRTQLTIEVLHRTSI